MSLLWQDWRGFFFLFCVWNLVNFTTNCKVYMQTADVKFTICVILKTAAVVYLTYIWIVLYLDSNLPYYEIILVMITTFNGAFAIFFFFFKSATFQILMNLVSINPSIIHIHLRLIWLICATRNSVLLSLFIHEHNILHNMNVILYRSDRKHCSL